MEAIDRYSLPRVTAAELRAAVARGENVSAYVPLILDRLEASSAMEGDLLESIGEMLAELSQPHLVPVDPSIPPEHGQQYRLCQVEDCEGDEESCENRATVCGKCHERATGDGERQPVAYSEHERVVLRLLDEMDAVQGAFDRVFLEITGKSPEWSNMFGLSEAVAEIIASTQSNRA